MGGVGVDWSLVAGLSSVQPDRWAALTLVVAVILFSRVCSRFSWLVFATSGQILLKSLVSRLCLGLNINPE